MRFKNKKEINAFILQVAKKYGTKKAAKLLNELQNLGFYFATLLGHTFRLSDFTPIEIKKHKDLTPEQFAELRQKAIEQFKQKVNPKNQILFMTEIGAARGYDNIANMFATRGYFVNVKDEFVERPVVSSLFEGLDKEEFFAYGNAARKGILDRVMFTEKPGYLYRQLVYLCDISVDTTRECTPKDYLQATIDEQFLYRYVKDGDKEILITEENLEHYKGKTMLVRSPMYCTLGINTICYKCAGDLHNYINSKLIGINAITALVNYFYTAVLKSMHTGARGKLYKPDMQKIINSLRLIEKHT